VTETEERLAAWAARGGLRSSSPRRKILVAAAAPWHIECFDNLQFSTIRGSSVTRSDKPGCLATVEVALERESPYKKDAAGVGSSHSFAEG
jgi:hypothetical protein